MAPKKPDREPRPWSAEEIIRLILFVSSLIFIGSFVIVVSQDDPSELVGLAAEWSLVVAILTAVLYAAGGGRLRSIIGRLWKWFWSRSEESSDD